MFENIENLTIFNPFFFLAFIQLKHFLTDKNTSYIMSWASRFSCRYRLEQRRESQLKLRHVDLKPTVSRWGGTLHAWRVVTEHKNILFSEQNSSLLTPGLQQFVCTEYTIILEAKMLGSGQIAKRWF